MHRKLTNAVSACTCCHVTPPRITAFDDAVNEQKELHPEPYPSFVMIVFCRLKFKIKVFVLKYVMRRNIYSSEVMKVFNDEEKEWIVCSSKWTKRLLLFFTDQTTGELAVATDEKTGDVTYIDQWIVREKKQWKEISGRSGGGDEYQFGDFARGVVRKIGQKAPTSNVTPITPRSSSPSISTTNEENPKRNSMVMEGVQRFKRAISGGDEASRSLRRSVSSLTSQTAIRNLMADPNAMENLERKDFELLVSYCTHPYRTLRATSISQNLSITRCFVSYVPEAIGPKFDHSLTTSDFTRYARSWKLLQNQTGTRSSMTCCRII